MADNVPITPGAGASIASDDIAGIQYQRVKPAWGVNGAAVDVSASNPMPVVQTGTPALAPGAATSANQATEVASLASIDTKTPALQLGFSPVVLPLVSGDRGNIIPSDFSAWVPGADTIITADSTGAIPVPGVTSWSTFSFTASAGQGATVTRSLSGRTDGARLLFSHYVRNRSGSTKSLNVQLRADDGSNQDFLYPPSVTIPADSVWYRVSFALVINIASATQVIMRIYGTPAATYALDVACAHLQQTENLTPSDYQPPLLNSNAPVLLNVPRISVALWGDSLVGGAGGFEFRTELSRLLNGSVMYNGGIGAETSTQVRERQAPIAWVASTAYALGRYRYNGVNLYIVTTAGTSAGAGGPTGTGTGIVDGTVTWSYYGPLSNAAIYNRYGVVVIEAGRNNMNPPATVLTDIANMVAAIPHGRWLIMEVWNNTGEPQGSATYGYMQQINEALYQRYGSRLIRWRQQFSAGSPTDIPYTNLMFDATHPNAAGQGLVAWSIFSSMNSNGYLPLAFGSQRNPRIGTATPGASQPVSMPETAIVLSTVGLSVVNTDLLSEGVSMWFDARNFHAITFDLIASAGIASGVVTFEQTNDITNAAAGTVLLLQNMSTTTAAPVSTHTPVASTVTKFGGPIMSGWVRLRISTVISGGTLRIAAALSQMPFNNSWTADSLANGQTAHSSPSTGFPLRIGGRVVSTLDATLVHGDASDTAMTTGQQTVVKDFASSENDWQYAGATGGIVNSTTAITVKAAGAAGIRNFVSGVDLSWGALGAATEFAIRDGASGIVLWRYMIPAGTAGSFSRVFATPKRGTAATLLEIVTLVASVTGGVVANLDGYQSA